MAFGPLQDTKKTWTDHIAHVIPNHIMYTNKAVSVQNIVFLWTYYFCLFFMLLLYLLVWFFLLVTNNFFKSSFVIVVG